MTGPGPGVPSEHAGATDSESHHRHRRRESVTLQVRYATTAISSSESQPVPRLYLAPEFGGGMRGCGFTTGPLQMWSQRGSFGEAYEWPQAAPEQKRPLIFAPSYPPTFFSIFFRDTFREFIQSKTSAHHDSRAWKCWAGILLLAWLQWPMQVSYSDSSVICVADAEILISDRKMISK